MELTLLRTMALAAVQSRDRIVLGGVSVELYYSSVSDTLFKIYKDCEKIRSISSVAATLKRSFLVGKSCSIFGAIRKRLKSLENPMLIFKIHASFSISGVDPEIANDALDPD